MRFRHLTSAVAQILLNASGGAILQAGGTLVIGTASVGQGTSYVYDTNLELQTTLTGSGGYYGKEITIGENKFAVAVHDGNDNGGQVYVYNHDGSGEQVLTASDGANGNSFGSTMDMVGDILVVGAPEARKVYIYDLSAADIAASEVKIHKSSIQDFGREIGVGGGKVIVGTQENNTTWSGSKFITGSAFVYDVDGTNEVQLIPQQNGHTLGYQTTDSGNRSNDEFGKLVAIGGDKIFVGARMQGNDDKGAVHVFSLDGTYETMITPSSPVGGSYFASGAIAVTDTKLVVTAPEHAISGKGTVYVFDHDGSNEVNFQSQYATSTMGRQSVAVLGNRIIVEWQGANSGKGQLHVFDMDGSNESVISAPAGISDNDLWGNEIDAITGSYPEKLIVAEGRKNYATDRKVYVMDMNGENVIELPEPEGLTQASNSQYASNIEIASEGKLVVIHNESKTAYVYDLTTTNEPTSFTLDGSNSTEDYDFVLDGNKLHTLGIVGGYRKKLMRYDITTGNLEAAFTTSGNYTLIPSTIDVGNGKVVVASGLGTTRRIFTYDIDDTTGASETMITPSKAATESLWNPCRLAVGNGKIVFGDSHTDAIFYIYNLDGSNEIAVDCSNVPLSSYWGSNYTIPSTQRVGYKSVAIGNDKIVVDGGSVGVAVVCNLDGSGLFAIDMMDPSYGLSSDEVAGAATEVAGSLSIANNKIAISAVQGRVSGNEPDGVVYTFDLDGTNMKQIVSPRVAESGYQFGKDVAIYDPTGLAKFANLPAVISDIDVSYILTEGQDTVITAVGTDPEGDALTWSFQEVKSAPSYIFVSAIADNGATGSVYVYDANDLSATPIKLTGNSVNANYGQAVALSGDTLVIGADKDDQMYLNNGAVYVYDMNDLSATPTKLYAFDADRHDSFGYAIAISSDKIFINARQADDNSDNDGAVYVYDRNDLSAQPSILFSPGSQSNEFFGNSMVITDDMLIVSAYRDPELGTNAGAVYVYDINDLSATPTKLTAYDGVSSQSFGQEIATTSGKLIVGAPGPGGSAPGAAYVYDLSDLSDQPTKLVPFDGVNNDEFGFDVAASGNKIIVGAHYKPIDNNPHQGAVYVYDASDLSAAPTKLVAPDDGDTEFENFGRSVFANSTSLIVGSWTDGARTGSSYVYDINDLSAAPTQLTAFDGAVNDRYGWKVMANEAPSALNDVTVSQSDNVFTITPGSIDSNFTLRFKVTDAAGNVTTKTSTFSYDYVNKAPIVSGVVSEYNLTQGQDTVITATAVDPEGDAITWSYEEIKSGTSYVVVSAIYDDDNGSSSGSVYVYDANDLSAQPTKLTAFDGTAGDIFGSSVTFSADKIIVGAEQDDDNGNASGSVYVYDANDLSAQPTKLTAFDGAVGDYFGVSVATTSDKIFVGASATDQDGNNSGSVYVYDINDLSATPTELTAFDGAALDFFGYSISTTADKVIVGAYGDESNSGAIYVYDANDLSAQPTKLTAFDGAAADFFGYRISTAADKIVVSAFADDDRGSSSGSVYVYDANDLSAQPTKLTAFDGAADDTFGYSVATSADKIIVGAHQDDDNATSSGSVYVYDANDLSAQPTKLTAFDPARDHVFGQSVAATDDKIFVGTGQDDDKGSSAGAVYVYDANDLSAQPTKLTAFDGAGNDYFGFPVSANSLPSALNGVTVSQTDNVFTITPGTASADFQLRITATDSEGNATSVTPTFDFDYQNQAPSVAGIDAAYTLTQGQDTVITAAATDPEGDAITWSFEEVAPNQLGVAVVQNTGEIDLVDFSGIRYKTISKPTDAEWFMSGANIIKTNSSRILVGGWASSISDDNGSFINSGGAFLFKSSGNLLKEIYPPNPIAGMEFGYSVDISENRIVVGAYRTNSNQGSAYVYDIDGNFLFELTAHDGQSDDWYGKSVACNNNYILVAAPRDDTSSVDTGSAYLYHKDGTFSHKLSTPSIGTNDLFGGDSSVYMTDNRIAIYSSDDDKGSSAGAVYLYDGEGSYIKKITAPDGAADDLFGYWRSIDITDNYVVIGSAYDDGGDGNDLGGSVYVFDINGNYIRKIIPHDQAGGGSFGMFITASGNNLFVTRPYDSTISSARFHGSIYHYHLSNGGFVRKILDHNGVSEWGGYGSKGISTFDLEISNMQEVTVTQSDNVFTVTPGQQDADFQLRITATDSEGNATSVTSDFTLDYQNQAPSVAGIDAAYTLTTGQDTVITAAASDPEGDAITWSFEEVASGSNYVIVGADTENDNGNNAGAVYVYDASDLSSPATKLNVSGNAADDRLGFSVDVSDDKIVIGSPFDNNTTAGAVYVFDTNNLSATPIELTAHDFTPRDEWGNQFGKSVAVTSNKIVVGAMRNYENGSNSGAAYVFDISDLSAQPTKLTAYDGAASDQFGQFVAASDDKIVIGSAYDDDNVSNSGSVYVYDANDLSAQPTKLTAFDGAVFDLYGYSVAATDDKIIVGAVYDDENVSNSGSVYVYDANDLSAQPTKLTAFDNDTAAYFGWSVSANADKIVVGAPRDNDNGTSSGSVYVFDTNDLSAQPTKLTAFDGIAQDQFGSSVAISGDKIVVGSGQGQFNVYVYDLNDLSAQPEVLTQTDGFGNAVAAISASSALNGVTVTQSDNVFTVTPGTTDADFQLRITATDSEGNATSVTSTFAYDFVNQPPVVSNVDAAYTLTQGQDTVITAAATDPEGDAVTWSYSVVDDGLEKNYVGIVAAGEQNKIHLYDSTDLNISPIIVTAPDGVYFNRGLSSYKNDILSSAGSLFAFDGHNTFSSEELVSYDAETTDNLGYSMVVHGDNIFLSAFGEESYTGAVYVYNAEDLSAQPLKITAPDGAANDHFGRVIEIVGDRLYVSAPYDDDNGTSSGSVYVFDINDLSANPIKLNSTGSDVSYDNFGTSISGFSQGKIAIGAQSADNPSSSNSGSAHSTGAVYVFDENNLTGTPIALTPSDITTGDQFGVSVSASDDKLFIGCPSDDEGANQNLDFDNLYNSGSVYVYDANNLSATPTKITAPNTIYNGRFGEKVLVVGDKLYVGSRYENVDRIQARSDRYQHIDFSNDPTGYGAVYVYDVNNLSAPPIKLTSDSDEKTSFGWKIVSLYIPESDTLNGVTIAQSDNVFTVTPGTASADFQLRITATDSEGNATSVTPTFDFDYQNQAPSVTGIDAAYTLTQGQDTQIVGLATDAEGEDITWSFEEVLGGSSGYVVVAALGDDGYDGSVYIYNSSDLSATPTKLDTPAGATNFFGRDFEIIGDNLIVTADGDDTLGNDAGAAFVYDMTDLSISPTKITAPDGASGNKFGYSVTSSSDKVIISSRAVGKVYVYDANDLTATPTILTGETNDFGDKVTSNSNYIFVSDPFNNHGGNRTGSVYVYDIDSLSLVTEIEHQASTTAYFGKALSANEEKLAVGGWIAGLVYVYDLNNLSSTPETTIYGYASHKFGISVGLSDNKLVVGASDQSKAYVYDLANLPEFANYEDNLNPNSSFYLGRLDPTNEPTSDDRFGYSVSVNDDNIVVAAYGDNNNTGSTYVYDANDLSATPTILTAFDGAEGDTFGSEVVKIFDISPTSALNGTTVAQSDNVFTVTPGQQDADFQLIFKATDTAGNVTSTTSDFTLDYVNQAPAVSGIDAAYTLTQGQDTVITAAATDPEGDAITWSFEEANISINQLFIGALGNNAYQGSMYVYNPTDFTEEPTLLTAPNGSSQERFGYSIRIDSDKVYIGELTSDESGEARGGAVYIYDRSDLSATPTMLLPPTGEAQNNLRFGSDIFVNGNLLIIGAYGWGPTTDASDDYTGRVYIYNKSDLSLQATLTPTNGDPRDWFGLLGTVAVTPNHILIGAYGDDDEGTDAGAVYVYDINTYAFVQKLTAPDASESDKFGANSIKTYGGKVYISAVTSDHNSNGTSGGAVYVYNESDLSFVEKLVAFDAAEGDYFGNSVIPHDDKLFVSATNKNSNAGAIYVYNINNLSATPTVLESPTANSRLGYSTNIIGDKLYASAHSTDDFDGGMYVYSLSDLSATPTFISPPAEEDARTIFGYTILGSYAPSTLNDTTVTQSDNVFTVTPGTQDADFQLTFKATDSEGNVTSVTSDFDFTYVNQAPVVAGIESSYLLSAGGDAEVITAAGSDVEGDAITWSFEEVMSNYVFVGATGDDDNGSSSGSVYVYDANDLSAQPTKLTAFDGSAYDDFGWSVAATADKIVIGARQSEGYFGSIYVYDTNDLSAQPSELTAFDGAAGDLFGSSVAATADKIVVGAFGDDDNGSSSGSVYVFDANDLSAQPTKLTAFDAAANDRFGFSVATTSDKIFVGAYGNRAVYVYDVNNLSATPTKLTISGGERFGYSVSATNDKIVVGDTYDDDNGSSSGSVYVFDANNLSASPTKVTAFDGDANDEFGNSVAVTADKIVVGAYFDDDNGMDSGSVYVYDANDLSAQPTKLTAFDGATDDRFGYSVAATADKIVVGAYFDDDNGSTSGSVYVYDANDLSAQPTKLTAFDGAGNDYFGHSVASSSAPSALNGVTVSQSDNVFTVTPGSEATSFSMRFTATDANGNATTTTSAFTVQESVMPDHPALAGRTIVVGAPYDNELRDNGTVTKSSPGAIYIYKDNTMTKVMPSSINDSGSHIKFGGVHNSTPVSTITSSKIYTGSEQFVYSYDLDGSSEFHFNMIDASLYSNSVRSKFNVWNYYFGSRAIAANDSYVAISAVGANNGSGSIAIFDPQGNFLYDIDGSENNDNNFGDKMVMLPNNRLVVGQRSRDYGGSNRGAMYLYSLGASSASLVKNVYGSTNNQQLGSNLETNGSLVVAGLHFSNGPTTGNQYEGYVSVYDSNLNHQFNIEAPAEVSASYLNFGKTTAIGSDKIAVSSGDYLINKVWFYDLSGNPIGEIEGPSNSSFAGAGSSRSIKIFGSGSSQLILITATGGDEEGANMGDIWIYDQNLNLIGRLSGYDSNGTGTTIDII